MKKARFVQDAKNDPSRFYRNPFDVIRDRRLSNADRLEVLTAWEKGAREAGAGAGATERLEQLRRVREELEKEVAAQERNSGAT